MILNLSQLKEHVCQEKSVIVSLALFAKNKSASPKVCLTKDIIRGHYFHLTFISVGQMCSDGDMCEMGAVCEDGECKALGKNTKSIPCFAHVSIPITCSHCSWQDVQRTDGHLRNWLKLHRWHLPDPK